MTAGGEFDVIVVGSGFGGAVIACRLAQAQKSVLVLERGRRWRVEDYPRGSADGWLWNNEDPARQNGWIDLRGFDDMVVVQGAAVGGGSLIYANVSIDAKPWVFESGWPKCITYDRLARHYGTVGEMLDVQKLPDNQLTKRFKLVREAAERSEFRDRFHKLPLAVSFSKDWSYSREDPHHERWSKRFENQHGQAQGTCIHCGYCDIGCPVQAKNTLDLNYLAVACNAGAEIRPLHLVREVRPVGRQYRVHYDAIEDGRLVAGSVKAKRVVLAAGSLGSTELLLRARDQFRSLPRVSSRLGYGWSSNGDFLTPAFYSGRSVAPTRGPTITCAVDFLDDRGDGNRFFVEDGGFPNLIGATVDDVLALAGKHGRVYAAMFERLLPNGANSTPLDCVMPWFGQAADAANGRLYLARPWWKLWGKKTLQLDWDVTASRDAIQALIDMHKLFSTLTGGEALEPVTWSWAKHLITPHPLGGCAMSDRPESGVVNGYGEVFNYPGLHVADGAVIPRALGLNPSRTIAALAEHIAEAIVEGRTGTPA